MKKPERVELLIIIFLCTAIFIQGLIFINIGKDAAEPVENGSLAGSYIVTAYCPCSECTYPYTDGYFANGEKVSYPALAAPSTIPFGTRMYVPGYGVAEVKDRGGVITGNRLETFFLDHQQAKEWGVQELMIEVVGE